MHRLLRMIDRIGPEGDKGLSRPSPAMDGSRLTLCRPFLQQIGISVNPRSGGRFRQAFGHPSGAPRERATFASFFLEIEAHADPRANQKANAKDCIELHTGKFSVDASVKQFSSGIPHSREFWAMAMRLSSSVQSAAANHTDRPAASFISME